MQFILRGRFEKRFGRANIAKKRQKIEVFCKFLPEYLILSEKFSDICNPNGI